MTKQDRSDTPEFGELSSRRKYMQNDNTVILAPAKSQKDYLV